MGRPTKLQSGICNACHKESQSIVHGHRIPIRIGGGRWKENYQNLCGDCNRRKTVLEGLLFDFSCETEIVRAWF